jgi:hypothetical protein
MFKKKILTLLFKMIIGVNLLLFRSVPTASAAPVFTSGVTPSGSASGTVWFKTSGWTAAYVILHYTVSGAGQQNVPMTYNSSTAQWEFTVSSLAAGLTMTYNFTYNIGGVQYDSDIATYTVGGGTTPPPPPPPPNSPGAPDGFWDSSNIPVAKNVMIFKFLNRTNGKYQDSEVYWSFNNQTHSIAEQPYFDMPANSSGRMYFYLGSPNSQYFDFIEFTIGPNQFNGNTTRVDAFGIKLAMRMHCADGYDVAVGEDYSLFQEDRAVTFQRFINEVPTEYKHLAQVQAPYRIVEPGAGQFKPGGLYEHYYDAFVNEMWANNGITIPKPGSNGEGLGNYPDISAAIYRHVGNVAGTFSASGKLLNNNLWTNSSTFYQAAPANYYAKFWHDHGLAGKAYGFPYDDVGGYSTYISHENPQYLEIAIGW